MKRILVTLLFFGLTSGLALSEGHSEVDNAEPPKTEEAKEKADCKKVCVKRDGYGKCIEFEEECE